MKVLMYLSYLIIFLWNCGNKVYSASQFPIHYASHQYVKKHQFAAVFNNIEKNGLDENDFADLVEDDSTEVNEGRDGKVFSKQSSLQDSWFLSFSRQLVTSDRFLLSGFIVSTPLSGSSTPLYITNRVLRL